MFRPKEQKFKPLHELNQDDDDHQFSWGLRKGEIKQYKSFTFEDIDYSLYDCVYLWRTGQREPDIGKLVRIMEMESHERKVEVVWFFRPSEIANWLGDIRPLQREIFLGCGHGKGLSNVNPLVICSHSKNYNLCDTIVHLNA